eukprot:SAG22_NODE_6031_length_913_cov_1.108108_1_plen_290_part_10
MTSEAKACPLNLAISCWNYLYDAQHPHSLHGVLGDLRDNQFGVELWPAFYSLEPYRPAYHPVISRQQDAAAEPLRRTGPVSTWKARPEEVGDLFQGQENFGALQAGLRGMRSAWHSRLFDEKPVHFGDFGSVKQELDTAAALGSEAISVHYLGSDGVDGSMSTVKGYAGGDRAAIQRCIDAARRANVALTIEPMEPVSVRRATAAFPDLQLCMDPCAVRFAPHAGGQSLQQYYDGIESKVGYVHLYDMRGDDGHLVPGCAGGRLSAKDWRYVLDMLSDNKCECGYFLDRT